MLRLLISIGLSVLLFVFLNWPNYSWSQETVRTIDGDTIEVGDRRIRLACIDAPEREQQKGQEATKALESLLGEGGLKYLNLGHDLYGRTLAVIYKEDKNLNQAMVSQGYAAPYYAIKCPQANEYYQARNQARDREVGIWSQKDPCMPWDYRAGNCNCDRAYPTICISPPPPDLNCEDLETQNFESTGRDPHNLDGDSDGIACEK